MEKNFKKIVLSLAFAISAFGMLGEAKADTATEDIVPDLNVIRSLDEKDQVNMYKTVVDEKGYQNITLNFDATQKDKVKNGWTLKVYDENKEEIYKVEGIKSQFTSGNFAFNKDQVVYISVGSSGTTSLFMPKGVEYNLNFHTYSANDYESEPNNKYLQANEIAVGSYVKGNLLSKSDEDYYVVRVNETGYTDLNFEIPDFIPDKIGDGWNIEIYDKNKRTLYKTYGVKRDFKFPELPFAKGQEIYIRIMAKSSPLSHTPDGIEYKLKADVVKTNKWEVEDNDSFSRANKLKGTISANILNSEDVDYFTFKAGKTNSYKVSLDTGDNVDREYEVEIFVKNKGKAKIHKLTMADKSFTFKVKKGQKVWVKISGAPAKSPIGNRYTVKYKTVKNVKKVKPVSKKTKVESKTLKSTIK